MRKIKNHDKSIHIVLHTNRMLCYAIGSINNQVTINKKEYCFNQNCITATLLFNPTSIYHALKEFMIEQQSNYPYSYFVLLHPLVQESIHTHHKPNALLQDLVKPDYQRNYYYKHIAMHNNQALFYVCNINKTVLLQLQLLCARLPMYLQTIKPPLSIQYDLYHHIHPQNISQAELAQAIDYQTVTFKNLFTDPKLYDIVSNKKNLEPDTNLAYALGSFIGAYT